MIRIAVALIIVFIGALLAGCSLLAHEAPTEDVDKAAALFFQRLNGEQYDTICDDLAKRFKENKTRQTVTDNLKQLVAHGKVLNHERVSMTFEGKGKDRMAFPVYATLFEQAKGEITLTFQDESGEWKLLGFAFKQGR